MKQNRLSPRGKVFEAASLVVPPGTAVAVRGRRTRGVFVAWASANGTCLAEAKDRDWRRAYKTLCIQLARRTIL
jgi:hypothetical protein